MLHQGARLPARVTRLALRVAYDGRAFHGSQRQPAARTVEGDLLAALAAAGAILDADSSRFQAASRTDRGVSAAGNVFAFDSAFRRGEILGAVNARLSDAWALAVAVAPGGFNPRASPLRRYAYFQPRGEVRDVARFDSALATFRGRHDFANFGRVEAHVDPVRDVRRIAVEPAGPHLRVDVEGPSFLWNQVRRMIGAALAVDSERATIADVERALAEPARAADFGLAPPEPLVLVEVAHDLAWESDARLRPERALAERVARADLERAIAGTLAGTGP